MAEPLANKEPLEPDPSIIFRQFPQQELVMYEEYLVRGTAYHSFPEEVRNWAHENGYKDKSIRVRIFARTSAIVLYVNRIVKEDTDIYKDTNDLKFHRDLMKIAADIEENLNPEDEERKREIVEDIKKRTDDYLNTKRGSTS